MRKYSRIGYITLILLIILSGFFVYKTIATDGKTQDEKSKLTAELKNLESKFTDLFNQLNNIKFENYTISSTSIEEEKSESESSSSGQGGEKSGSQGDKSGGQGGQSGGSSSGSSSGSGSSEGSGGSQKSEQSSDSQQKNKEYKLQSSGVLTGDFEPDWKQIKIEVEKVYTFLYPLTIDLYKIVKNQDDIVNFNKEYDNLTKAVKEEDKKQALLELTLLYDYLPKFFDEATDEEKQKIIIKTKNNIFKAYSILDEGQWTTISENINKAIQEFTKLVTNVDNIKDSNQYNINKTYVIINELHNAVLLKDKEVFLIKYKNLLEELENI